MAELFTIFALSKLNVSIFL